MNPTTSSTVTLPQPLAFICRNRATSEFFTRTSTQALPDRTEVWAMVDSEGTHYTFSDFFDLDLVPDSVWATAAESLVLAAKAQADYREQVRTDQIRFAVLDLSPSLEGHPVQEVYSWIMANIATVSPEKAALVFSRVSRKNALAEFTLRAQSLDWNDTTVRPTVRAIHRILAEDAFAGQ